jgi:hypothetical protein
MEEISLRPMALRPGGGITNKNPFASFGKGAGASLAKKVSGIIACMLFSKDASMAFPNEAHLIRGIYQTA